MEEFEIYLKLGFKHITDINGYDHILFVTALCAIYQWTDWKKVGILITAFTLGHSITLALASLQIVKIDSQLVEFLIPITIIITCFLNIFTAAAPTRKTKNDTQQGNFRYILALGFGFIHGLGFSNYLRSLLGKEDSLWKPLLAFNLGLEVGQLLIISILLTLCALALSIIRVHARDWRLVLSALVAGMAIVLTLNAEYMADVL